MNSLCEFNELAWAGVTTAGHYYYEFLVVAARVIITTNAHKVFRHRFYQFRLFCSIPAWCIVKVGQLIGASFEIQGLENIDKNAGGVVVINHQSAIDLIVLGKLWPVIGRATQVSKKEIFYIFPFGLACYLWGTLFINRQNQSSARNAINKESKAINDKKVGNQSNAFLW